MSELQINRTPGLIAAEINRIKEDTRKVVIYNSIEIGRRLVEAKEILEHGQWGKWLETEVNYSKTTANNLMKIFQEYGPDQLSLLQEANIKSQAFGDLTYSQAVELLRVPVEEREDFVKENDVNKMSTRELKKVIDDLKKAENDKDKAIKARDKAKKELENMIKVKETLEKAFDEGAEARRKLEEEKAKLEEDIKKKENEILKIKTQPLEIEADQTEIEMKYQDEIDKSKVHIEELEKKLKKLEASSGEGAARFKVHFDNIVSDFNKLLQELANIKNENEIQYTKLNSATRSFINTMLERL